MTKPAPEPETNGPARRPLPALSIRGDNLDLATAPPPMPADMSILSIYNATMQASIMLDKAGRRALIRALDSFDTPRLTVAPADDATFRGKP